MPCGLGCAATRDLAAAVLAALDAATPGFAARWRDLAARVQVIDHRGRSLALTGAGDLARGLTITAATAFAVAPDDALGPVAIDAPDARGRANHPRRRAGRRRSPRPAVRIALVLPYGARSDGFFPDTFAGQLAADARAAGHHAEVVRVYYAGDRGADDRAIAARLAAWLEDGGFDVVALERMFDPAPIAAWKAGAPHRRVVLVVRGDSIEPTPEVDAIVGWRRGATRTGHTRRAVTVWQIADAFAALIAALATHADPATVPGVATVVDGAIAHATPLPPERGPRRALAPVLDQATIAIGAAPTIVRRTVFGNAGCPYAADPRALPMYRDVAWPADVEVAERGCAFCSLGGDYERRADAEVIASLVAQAAHIARHAPATRALVLDDQHALRYLAELLTAAAAAGVPPLRWLFAARSDTFVRERPRVEAAIAAAAATGATVELYLTGFEAWSDAELARYNKGVTVAEQLAAVAAMRALAAAHPRAFAFAEAKGHSLICGTRGPRRTIWPTRSR